MSASSRWLRRISGIVVMTLAVGAVTLAGESGVAVAVTPEDRVASSEAPAYGPAEASDVASARLMARLQGRRIEVLGERSGDSSTFVEADGSLTAEAYAGPVRVRQGDGSWADIDTDLADAGADLKPRVAAADVAVSDGGDKDLASVTSGSKTFGLGWSTALPAPAVEGNTATYDLGGGASLTVEALAQGFEQSVVLASAPQGPVSYRIPLTLEGLELSKDPDSRHLMLKDAAGKLVAEAAAPHMWDSSRDAVSGELVHQAEVTTEIETAGDGLTTLVLTPDPAFFGQDLTYPVTVDPSSTLAVTTDTWVQSPDYPDSQIGSQELKAGTYDTGSHVARSYVKFDVAKFAGKHITSASMSLYSYYSSTCANTGPGTQARRVTSPLDTSTLTWGVQPSTTTTNMFTNTGHWGYDASCPASWSYWTLTGMVQDWANGSPNYGIQVRSANESDPTTWRRFRSANYTTSGYAPKLVVNYNSKPSQATLVAPVNGAATNDTTPTLQAKATDADGDKLTLHFEVWNSTVTTMIASGDSQQVNSGVTGSWTAPALAQGTYKWRALARDGTDGSPTWPAWNTLTVDTTTPGTTAVSSTDFPANTWSGTADANGDFSGSFTFTPPASDTASVVWNLDGGTAHTHTTTGAAVTDTISFRAGKHTLGARTHDKAGNASALTQYVFYAGSGAALLTPADGDTPARRVSLTGQGKPAEIGVTYQYRRGEYDAAWHNVPTADVTVTSSGATLSSWPLSAPGGIPAALIWNITNTLVEDGSVDVRAVFTDGTASDNSPSNTITVDRDAGTAPSSKVGPGEVNLLTGDFTFTEQDASAFGASVDRTFSSRSNATDNEGQAGIFGSSWAASVASDGSASYTQLRKTSSTSVEVLGVDGSSLAFTATSSGGWTPEPGNDSLTLTGSLTGQSFILKDTEANVTVFKKASTTATTWTLASTATAVSDSQVTIASETATYDSKELARPKYVISPTEAVPAATCQADPSTKGCRVLEFVYADTTSATADSFGDYKGQVQSLKLWSTAPGAASSSAVAVSLYAYDAVGRLSQVWDPRLGTSLKTVYTYDSAGRVVTETEGGELPWTFSYGKVGSVPTSGDGMLLTVSRPTLLEGSVSTVSGEAFTSVVYEVPTSGAAAPYAMDKDTVSTWAQDQSPTDATALFPADNVPASHSGGDLSADAYDRATITYINANGDETNTASPGGGISVTEYNAQGSVNSELTAANRALALGAAPDADVALTSLGLANESTAARAELLSTRTAYSADGQQVTDVYGPLHQVTLKNELAGGGSQTTLSAGSAVAARQHTSYVYDENRPSDAAVSGLATSTTVGASVRDYPTDADAQTASTTYDWSTGQPLTSTNGSAVTYATYDTAGRVASTRTAASNGSDAGTLRYTYYTADGSGTCGARPEWAGMLCRTAPAAVVSGGGGNPAELVTTVFSYDQWGQVATKAETANGFTRTTTVTTDVAGRTVRTAITGGQGKQVSDVTLGYDPNTGQLATQLSGGRTIAYRYDVLGRQLSYDDGNGNVTETSYDVLDRPVEVTDSAPSDRTFTYNAAGLVQSVSDTGIGTYSASYDADGNLVSESLPGGYQLAVRTDTVGNETERQYTDLQGTVILSDVATIAASGQLAGHTQTDGSTIRTDYSYDSSGHLVEADDVTAGGCTSRTYTFDVNSNRTGLTTTSDDCVVGTDDTTTSAVAYSYDSGDRLLTQGRVYDAFGRTIAAGPSTWTYYTNDLVSSETIGTRRNEWTLDAAGRLAIRTAENQQADGTWAAGTITTSHYGCGCDSPSWTKTSTGVVTRISADAAGGLGATTTSGQGVVLQLSNLHADIAVQLPLNAPATPVVQRYDEYGDPQEDTVTTAYGWLGSAQRDSDTLSAVTLMGVRLYDPSTGRFLQTDPVYGGNDNAYEYCRGNPVSCTDLSGAYSYSATYYLGFYWSSAKTVFNWIRHHFWVFPLTGCGATLSKGERCNLAYGKGPVRVTAMGKTYWQFTSLPGHIEGAGKKIEFHFGKKYGMLHMTVKAAGPNNTWCNRNGPCSWLNSNVFAEGMWGLFSVNISLYTSLYGVW